VAILLVMMTKLYRIVSIVVWYQHHTQYCLLPYSIGIVVLFNAIMCVCVVVTWLLCVFVAVCVWPYQAMCVCMAIDDIGDIGMTCNRHPRYGNHLTCGILYYSSHIDILLLVINDNILWLVCTWLYPHILAFCRATQVPCRTLVFVHYDDDIVVNIHCLIIWCIPFIVVCEEYWIDPNEGIWWLLVFIVLYWHYSNVKNVLCVILLYSVFSISTLCDIVVWRICVCVYLCYWQYIVCVCVLSVTYMVACVCGSSLLDIVWWHWNAVCGVAWRTWLAQQRQTTPTRAIVHSAVDIYT